MSGVLSITFCLGFSLNLELDCGQKTLLIFWYAPKHPSPPHQLWSYRCPVVHDHARLCGDLSLGLHAYTTVVSPTEPSLCTCFSFLTFVLESILSYLMSSALFPFKEWAPDNWAFQLSIGSLPCRVHTDMRQVPCDSPQYTIPVFCSEDADRLCEQWVWEEGYGNGCVSANLITALSRAEFLPFRHTLTA